MTLYGTPNEKQIHLQKTDGEDGRPCGEHPGERNHVATDRQTDGKQ